MSSSNFNLFYYQEAEIKELEKKILLLKSGGDGIQAVPEEGSEAEKLSTENAKLKYRLNIMKRVQLKVSNMKMILLTFIFVDQGL